ncbi:MAG: VWA domain-containing protein [Candidatus Cloacimonetes bacterium]|nr:VWA domain-containing protein [Candidatus Cloacimonadota bacterium]
MNIYHPNHLWLLWILVPVVLLLLWQKRRRRARFERFADQQYSQHWLGRHSPFFQTLKYVLMMLALVFIILALLRPQWDFEDLEHESAGMDVIICLDLSLSMDATDMMPTRLQWAKLQTTAFIEKLKDDRVGLISFAGNAIMECPLTDDHEAVTMILSGLDTSSTVRPGTDIGAALSMAENSFISSGGNATVLLITDGEDLQGNGVAQARRLASAGRRVFVMGIGTEEGAWVQNPATGERALSRLDVNTLKKIAAVGNGEFFMVSPAQTELETALDHMLQQAGRSRKRTETAMKDQYAFGVVAALILLLAESLILPLRPREKRG